MITRGFLVDILLRCCGDYRVIRVYKALGDIVFFVIGRDSMRPLYGSL